MHPSPDAFQAIPGVGRNISRDFWDLGFQDVEELRGQNPEELYLRLCALRKRDVDRCMLYVFRCAVYYASTKDHDPDMLQWWNWSDRNLTVTESNCQTRERD